MYERVLILEKALEIMAEKGYYRTTMEEIANRTNLKKTTVYKHLKNKEELFMELLQMAATARKQEVFDNIGITDDLREKLSRFIISLIRFARNQRNYYRVLTMEIVTDNQDFQEQVKQIQAEFQENVYQLLQAGIREEKFRTVNPLIATTFLAKLIEGALEIIEVEPNYSPDQIVLSMMDLVWNGLAKK